jgi:hypothetical protein
MTHAVLPPAARLVAKARSGEKQKDPITAMCSRRAPPIQCVSFITNHHKGHMCHVTSAARRTRRLSRTNCTENARRSNGYRQKNRTQRRSPHHHLQHVASSVRGVPRSPRIRATPESSVLSGEAREIASSHHSHDRSVNLASVLLTGWV